MRLGDTHVGRLVVLVAALWVGGASAAETIPPFSIDPTWFTIDGNGFYLVGDWSDLFYTRAGIFRFNADQVLVNSEEQPVFGFGVTSNGVPNGALGNIDLSTASLPAHATRKIEVNVNLDPNQSAPPPFDQLNAVGTSNFQVGIQIFDSLAIPHAAFIYFRKAGTLAQDLPIAGLPERAVWEYFAGATKSELDPSVTPPAAADQDFVAQDWGLLEFDANGALVRHLSGDLFTDGNADGTSDVFDYDGAGGGAPPGFNFKNEAARKQRITFDMGRAQITEWGSPTGSPGLGGTTQLQGTTGSGLNNFVRSLDQDGFPPGVLQSISFDENGFVIGSFSNGEIRRLAQIALAVFPDPYLLENVGSSFVATTSSGWPIIGSPNQGGFGSVEVGLVDRCLPQLDICVYEGPLDPDQDGILSAVDRCPDTPPGSEVDEVGCSRSQACSQIELQGRSDFLTCRRYDWRNDEPLRRWPSDCRVSRRYGRLDSKGFQCVGRDRPTRTSRLRGDIPPLAVGANQFTVDGDGFFPVEGSNRRFYASRAMFHLDANRNFTNEKEQLIVPPITIPSDTLTVTIMPDGRVRVTQPGSSAPSQVGRIQLARFPDPAELKKVGDSFAESFDSGPPFLGIPGQGGFGTLEFSFADTCDRELEICMETGSVDVDGDGIPFAADRCHYTLFPDEVDEAGCSAEQFCASVDVRRLRDAFRCLRSDWHNDEPSEPYPNNCTLAWAGDGEGWAALLCVAR